LPAARAQRQTEIAALRDMPLTMIFYESPKRIQEMLEDLREILGGSRDVAVCRELTKKFEEVTRGTLDEVIDAYEGRSVKGELVVLVGRAGATDVEEMDVETALRQAMETMRVKDAATAVAGALGLPKRQVYQIALGLSKED
jgi:16S rRNA (cytidine1402-2'-O)-methyltransferase